MDYGLHDLLGNVGVTLILAAYVLVQAGRLDARGLAASLVNAIGAALIVASLSVDFNLSAFVVEAAWCLISLLGVARTLRARHVRARRVS